MQKVKKRVGVRREEGGKSEGDERGVEGNKGEGCGWCGKYGEGR
jgi:hypothetical protein